jgi:NAD(P)-dependent dehydrogenase (short-subunit alcohol dehydrogenase family)/acyl carrier protein
MPVVYLTAHYALNRLARLTAGESILVHSGAGGVGIAAIQLARRAGAEVYATAGTPEKRRWLLSLGVRAAMDSRSLDFAREVLEVTSGRGVNVVLNSLSGEAIAASLAVLAPYGRFLEIGKRDIYGGGSLPLEPFRKSLAYFAIDLDRMARDRPDEMGEMLGEVTAMAEAGEIEPLPRETFPVSRVAEAFRHMAQARHVGKILVSLGDEAAEIEADPEDGLYEGTYLVTGGMGALGMSVARALSEKGVRHLALLARRAPAPDAAREIRGLERRGVVVKVLLADVSDEGSLERALDECRAVMPPFTGVVHAAGILDDGVLTEQTPERFAAVSAPKVRGAWNLHVLTGADPVRRFILSSSVAGIFGLPGQGNYAAANAFLDALADHRRSLGLPATTVQWGPWRIGLAAGEGRSGRLEARGLRSLSPEEGRAHFLDVLEAGDGQIVVSPIDWKLYADAFPAARRASLFAHIRASAAPAASEISTFRAALLAEDVGRRRRELMESHLQEQVARVLRLAPSRVERGKPLRTLGLDSLMALELRNRLESTLELKLPATLVWNFPTITALAPHLASRMEIPLEAPSPGAAAGSARAATAPEASPDDLARVLAEVETLTAEQARRELAEER